MSALRAKRKEPMDKPRWTRSKKTLAGHIARIPRPPFRRADAAIVWTHSVLRQCFVHPALELAVEAENARIHERQNLRQYNAGDVTKQLAHSLQA